MYRRSKALAVYETRFFWVSSKGIERKISQMLFYISLWLDTLATFEPLKLTLRFEDLIYRRLERNLRSDSNCVSV